MDTLITTLRANSLRSADITRDTLTSVVYIASHRITLRCITPCVRAIGDDGNPYWKFTSDPVVAFRSNADREFAQSRSDIQPGDIISTVNGASPLEERGAVALTHASLLLPLELEVRRSGERTRLTLRR